MKVASQVETGEGEDPRQRVSPLEQTLDAAVESERHRWVRAARDRAELMRAAAPSSPAALAVGNGSEAGPLSERRPVHLPAHLLARYGAREEARPLGRRPARGVKGWVQLCAVALGVLALVTAFQLPVPAPLPAPALEPAARTSVASPAPAPAGDVRAPGAAVTTGEAAQLPAEPVSQTSMLRPAEPRDGAAARATLDTVAPGSAVAAASPARPEPPRPSAEPAVQRAQSGPGPASPARRADVVTVHDLFGIGGDEPLPPEALEAPAPAPPAPRAPKPPRAAPAAPPTLFYHDLPF